MAHPARAVPARVTMVRRILSAALLLAVAGLCAGLVPIVTFPREEISIELYPDHLLVDGLYVYHNPWPIPVAQGFTLPLPVDASHPAPIEVEAWRLTPERAPLPLRIWWGEHRFELRFDPGEEIAVQVHYRQQAPGGDGRYLLTTTAGWRRPLSAAVYRLLPRGVDVIASNYPLAAGADGARVFVRERFMPPEDWRFAWRVKP